MSQAQYARHRGKSRQYISKLVSAGVLVMHGKLVDVAASDAVLDDRPAGGDGDGQDQAPAAPAAGSEPAPSARPTVDGAQQQPASYAQARLVDLTYRARLRRLEFEKAQGKLIDAEAVRKQLADANRALRDGLLAIPGRLAPTCAAETDQKKVHSLMEQEIKRELERQASAVDAI
jgi:hypothetical protein